MHPVKHTNPDIQQLLHVLIGLHAWIDDMKNYTHAQYGKAELLRLYETTKIQCMNSMLYSGMGFVAGDDEIEHMQVLLFLKPAKRWSWDAHRFKYIQAVRTDKNESPNTYEVCSNGEYTAVFEQPQAGMLLVSDMDIAATKPCKIPTNMLGSLDVNKMPLSYRKLCARLNIDIDFAHLGYEIQAMQVQVTEARLLYRTLVNRNVSAVRAVLNALKPLLR